MASSISIQQLYDIHHHQLELEWDTGAEHTIHIIPDEDDVKDYPIVGYFNSIHPNQIQVLGQKELDYFASLDEESITHILNTIDCQKSSILIIAKGATVPRAISQFAEIKKMAVLTSALTGKKLIEYLRYYLTRITSDRKSLHGVFMEVMGIGVLISGPSGIGKSELALELLSRGHRLIADDAPEFIRTGPDVVQGTGPEMLQGFIEVRGLSILNVRAMFGETAILQTKRLRLVINMQLFSETEHNIKDRLDTTQRYENILDVDIPVVILPVAPGRNLAVIVEAAVRNHVLRLNGYNATEDFIKRQQKIMHSSDE